MANVNFKNFRKRLLEGSIGTISGNYSVTLMSSEASFSEDDISISQVDYNAWMIAVSPLSTFIDEVDGKFVWKANQVIFNGSFKDIRSALVHSNDLSTLIKLSDFERIIEIIDDDLVLNFNNGIASL